MIERLFKPESFSVFTLAYAKTFAIDVDKLKSTEMQHIENEYQRFCGMKIR